MLLFALPWLKCITLFGMRDEVTKVYEILLFAFHTLAVFALGMWFGRVNAR